MSVKALRAALAAAPAAPAGAENPSATAELVAMAGDVLGLDALLRDSRLQVGGAQAALRLLLPAGVDPEHYGAWAAGQPAPEDGLGRAAPAVADDARLYVHLDGLRVSLAALLTHNHRFGTVIDLIAAATHLLDASTVAMATRLVRAHLAQCRQVLGQIGDALQAVPRLAEAMGAGALGPLN